MTFSFRALSDIEDDIQYRFSAGGMTARHSEGEAGRIRQLFNVSWQQLREKVSLLSDGSYLKGTTPASLPTSAAETGEVYAEIDWPVNAVGIYGVRVKISETWYPLKRIPFAAYQDFQYQGFFASLASQRGPIGYTPRLLPEGNETAEAVGKIMIVPVPTSGTYRLWYLEAWQPQVEDDDLFYGHSDWIEWALLNTCIKMSQPDGDSENQYRIWVAERKECSDQMEARARRLDNGSSIEPRDARFDGHDFDQWGENVGFG